MYKIDPFHKVHDTVEPGELLRLHWQPSRRQRIEQIHPKTWWAIAIEKDGLDWHVQIGEHACLLRWLGPIQSATTGGANRLNRAYDWSLTLPNERMIYYLTEVQGCEADE